MKVANFVLTLLLCFLVGVTAGYGGVLLTHCVTNWYHGGTPDPRCVLGWHGYIEVHHTDASVHNRITCEYRADTGVSAEGSS